MFPPLGAAGGAFGQAPALANAGATQSTLDSDAKLKELYEKWKKECFDGRQIYERIWLRNIFYRMQRQWITYVSHPGEWRDTRLARGIPKPTTSKPAEIERAIRAMFTGINVGINARPNGRDPKNVTMAALVDDLVPLLRDVHDMNAVMTEFDYWFIICGNAFLHTWWDNDIKHGSVHVPYEQCVGCGLELLSSQIADSGGKCPSCVGTAFMPTDRTEQQPQGKAVTTALSPLEIAFPLHHARWSDVMHLIRMRWREKSYYEQHPELKQYVDKINWQKTPTDRSLSIFKSLPFHSELGSLQRGWSSTPSGDNSAEGISEFEMWVRPCGDYPEGLVARFAGEGDPVLLHIEEEGLPGPLPYRTKQDRPLFTFSHAAYEHIGGRVFGSGPIDTVVPLVDQYNRISSMIEMHVSRLSNGVWKIPKGAEVQWLGDSPGLPGLMLEWNALAAGGNAKPEREAGIPLDASLIALRDKIAMEIEVSAGTNDILKGVKPPGIEAFSALQALIERAQSVFNNAFQSRGECHREWAMFALELERAYGPETRTKAVLTPARGYIFKEFQRVNLEGDVTIVIENGTNTPKTALGRRANMEHANQLQIIDAKNPETQYAMMVELGLTHLIPGMDHHVQAALNKQEAFETWLREGGLQRLPPGAMPWDLPNYPLRWKRWYDPDIHRAEFMKWANSDRMSELITEFPDAEMLIDAHLMELDMAIGQKMMGQLSPGGQADAGVPPPGAPPPNGTAPSPGPGQGQAMNNSNQNSAPAGNTQQPAVGV